CPKGALQHPDIQWSDQECLLAHLETYETHLSIQTCKGPARALCTNSPHPPAPTERVCRALSRSDLLVAECADLNVTHDLAMRKCRMLTGALLLMFCLARLGAKLRPS